MEETESKQLTSALENDTIYFGIPDWVYEGWKTKCLYSFNIIFICIFFFYFYTFSLFRIEEVLGTGSAMWFSPDGKHLAYAEFNDNKLPDFSYFIYGEPGSLDDQYPTEATIKYPKVNIGTRRGGI